MAKDECIECAVPTGPVEASSPAMAERPPGNLPVYRLLTGPDDASFCKRVSAELARGFQLYGPPCLTFDGKRVVAGQAIIWPATLFSSSRPGLN